MIATRSSTLKATILVFLISTKLMKETTTWSNVPSFSNNSMHIDYTVSRNAFNIFSDQYFLFSSIRTLASSGHHPLGISIEVIRPIISGDNNFTRTSKTLD